MISAVAIDEIRPDFGVLCLLCDVTQRMVSPRICRMISDGLKGQSQVS